METRAHYVLIGAFVLITMALAFLFVLWLGQTQRDYDEYDIIFRERVSGLTVGAAVSFNGIQKGEVMDLTIPDDPSIVIARIRVDNDTPVKTDTKAELELVGFTGLAIIQLVGGTADEPLLKDVTRGIPRIEADASGIAQLLAGSGDIVAGANRLLSEENIEAFSRILKSVDTVTASLAEEEDNIAATVANTAKLTEELAAASEKLARASESFERLMASDAPEAVADARRTLKETELLVAELRGAVAENRDSIKVFTNQGLAQVGPAVAEARQLFRTLDQVLREIDRDPRGYLLGESTPLYEGKE
jgi:phospholipid/cholesterol/gamma-HCH transport system substrate-binding protein